MCIEDLRDLILAGLLWACMTGLEWNGWMPGLNCGWSCHWSPLSSWIAMCYTTLCNSCTQVLLKKLERGSTFQSESLATRCLLLAEYHMMVRGDPCRTINTITNVDPSRVKMLPRTRKGLECVGAPIRLTLAFGPGAMCQPGLPGLQRHESVENTGLERMQKYYNFQYSFLLRRGSSCPIWN